MTVLVNNEQAGDKEALTTIPKSAAS